MSRSDSFGTRRTLTVGNESYDYYSLAALAANGFSDVPRLPFVLKVLLENLLRCEDGVAVTRDQIEAVARWQPSAEPAHEINFTPARVLLQDFTGVPAIVDLAAMRDAMAELGGDPARINPRLPSELVIDHSVQVDRFGRPDAFRINADLEYERNGERYAFLRWGQRAFNGLQVVPPDTGIVHQVNLEYLARVVFTNERLAYPDSLVGTDSHTPMVNGLGVLAWGVGGIEAEAAMLGQPITLLVPQVVGVRLRGRLPAGTTATDLVLTVTERLRRLGVVDKFVEFFGEGLAALALADRATLGNMSPEFGSTCAISPIDAETLRYMHFTNRGDRAALIEAYARAQGMYSEPGAPEARYSEVLDLDLNEIEPSLAGPRLPHVRVALGGASKNYQEALGTFRRQAATTQPNRSTTVELSATDDGGPARFELSDGAVVIAAITSCTNTSNPDVMVAAGLLAKKAVARGLQRAPWVKTSLAPGSLVVTSYLDAAKLTEPLEQLGFYLVGYGCTTCIGNSGPLPGPIAAAVAAQDLHVVSVLSGNRNFEGRISPQTRANYLASPPLVVAYAIAGRMDIDLTREPLGLGRDGRPVFLADVWPSPAEIADAVAAALTPAMFRERYATIYQGDPRWRGLNVPAGARFVWESSSTYIRQPTFFAGMTREPAPLQDLVDARALAVLGDSVTTDHISPAGSIAVDSPAGEYLLARGVTREEFNSYGARRGNHEVMIRGTFANIRLRNLMVPGVEGGWTCHQPSGERLTIFAASERYAAEGVPLVILAGAEYGTGSSRDWAAKGTRLLGVRVVIARSFERIHRSNLIGMGVLPLQFNAGQDAHVLGLRGDERYAVRGLAALAPHAQLAVEATRPDGSVVRFEARARINTPNELIYLQHGGILNYVLRQLMA
jgi:aconitate hydratase